MYGFCVMYDTISMYHIASFHGSYTHLVSRLFFLLSQIQTENNTALDPILEYLHSVHLPGE